MNMLMRPVMALCIIVAAGIAAPAQAQNYPQVCCSYKDAAGGLHYFLAPYTQCPKAQVAKPGYCKNISVCCKMPGGYQKVPFPKCTTSQVPDSYCRQQSKRVCCVSANGFYWDTEQHCRNSPGSKIADTRYCSRPKEPICCKGRNGYVKVTPNDCVTRQYGHPVSDSYCRKTERKVCCRTPNGFYPWTASMCKKAHGTIVNSAYCKQTRKVCCKYTKADGTVAHTFLDPRKCKSLHGSQVSNNYCIRLNRTLKLRRK